MDVHYVQVDPSNTCINVLCYIGKYKCALYERDNSTCHVNTSIVLLCLHPMDRTSLYIDFELVFL